MVGFKGNPVTVPGKWSGDSWPRADLPADANNYFSLAVFKPDKSGQYRRTKHASCSVCSDAR